MIRQSGTGVDILNVDETTETVSTTRSNGDAPSGNGAATRICSVDDCDGVVIAKGLCGKHYDRMRRYGTTDIPPRPTECKVEGCDNSVRAKGLCNMHYKRLARYGSTEPRPRVTICTVEGCEQSHLAKGLCRFHYDQDRRSGKKPHHMQEQS
jgi:hypothetical protein